MSNFGAILTTAGAAKLANAIALGVPLKLTQMAVGDGNGQPVAPDPAMNAIPGEKRRAAINTLFADPLAASQLVAEQIIPEDVGGWWIRCVGLYDDSNTLIAIANVPDTYKPLLTSGAGRTQIIRMVLIVSDTNAVELKIDPAVVLATRQYVDEVMKAHKESRDHPAASEDEKGFSRLASQAQTNAGIADDVVITPKKMKWGFSINLSPTGYIIMPAWLGGLIIQWGILTTETAGKAFVTFPVAYPNACLNVTIGETTSSDTSGNIWASQAASRTGFTGIVRNIAGAPVSDGAYYFSIGY